MTAEQDRLLLHLRRIAIALLVIAAIAGAAFAFFTATTLRPPVRALSRGG